MSKWSEPGEKAVRRMLHLPLHQDRRQVPGNQSRAGRRLPDDAKRSAGAWILLPRAEAPSSFTTWMKRVSDALKSVKGAVKMNFELHGNTITHLHVHFFLRGDRFEDRPIDLREPWLPDLSSEELEAFADALRAALVEG